jgi:hypothetical protein
MCGDTHCPSCGPAQGNGRCPICRAWADDGCERIGIDGNLLPEWQEDADALAKAEAEADEAYAKEFAPDGYPDGLDDV